MGLRQGFPSGSNAGSRANPVEEGPWRSQAHDAVAAPVVWREAAIIRAKTKRHHGFWGLDKGLKQGLEHHQTRV